MSYEHKLYLSLLLLGNLRVEIALHQPFLTPWLLEVTTQVKQVHHIQFLIKRLRLGLIRVKHLYCFVTVTVVL